MLKRKSNLHVLISNSKSVRVNFIVGVILFFALSLMNLLNNQAYAATCATTGGNYTYSGAQSWPRDIPVGYVGGKVNSQGTVWNMNCIGDTSADRDVYFTMNVIGSPVPGYTDVYATNMPGVGVRYNFALNSGNPSFCNVQFDDHISYSSRQYTCHLLKNTSQAFSLGSSLQFVKLSSNVTSGFITSIPTVTASYSLNNQSGTWNLNNVWSSSGQFVINVLACSINTPNLVFPIGDVLASSFGSSIGTTPAGAQNTQNLGLNCDSGVNIYVALNGTQNPDVGTTSVLALTNQGGADVAKGVGVQILYNGSPLLLNNRIVMKQSSGGQETFPITARYYQTKTAVTTGKANASATLDLTYQ